MRHLLALLIAAPALAAGPKPESMPAAIDVEWRLLSLGGVPVQTRRPVTLTLSKEGKAFGSGGCNRYSGTFRISAGTIAFPGPMAATMRACVDGGEIEGPYLERLAKGGQARVEAGNRLRISRKGEPDLVFEKAGGAAGARPGSL